MYTDIKSTLVLADLWSMPTAEVRNLINQLSYELHRRANVGDAVVKIPPQYMEKYVDPDIIKPLKRLCFEALIEEQTAAAAFLAYQPTLEDLSKVKQSAFMKVDTLDKKKWREITAILESNGYKYIEDVSGPNTGEFPAHRGGL